MKLKEKLENNRELHLLLAEIALVLERGIDTESYVLTCRQEEMPGYRYVKSEGELLVSYGTRPDLCRALLAAACSKDRQGQETRSFREFGYMADCSRNAVARVETLKKLVKLTALMGYQFLGLYLEDTIAVEGEPYSGYMRGAYTKEEIREVIRYADLFDVEIRPYVQTLAHLNQITRYEHYQKFIDTDDILLADDERTYQFLDHYLKAVSDAFTTRFVNIGMDEAHMVGLGKYLDRHGYRNRVEIIQEHLKRVMEICDRYGLHPQMWSDMFFRLAFGGEYYVKDKPLVENINIPEGLELAYWDYYSTDEKHYDEMLRQHRRLTDKVCFAGGVWKWTGFAPHNRYSMSIGKSALAACRRNGVTSVVITGWGDDGAEASQFSVLPGLFADANEAYEGGLTDPAFLALTGIKEQSFLEIENSNPYSERSDRHNNAGKYLLYNDPLIGTFDSVAEQLPEEYYQRAAEDLEKTVQGSKESSLCYVLQTQASLCRVLQDKALLGIEIRTAYQKKDTKKLREIAAMKVPELVQRLDQFYQDFRTQWMLENKAFGFEVQTIRIGGLRQRLLETRERLLEYLEGSIPRIEELEETPLPYAYSEETELDSLDYNLWSNIATPSVMG